MIEGNRRKGKREGKKGKKGKVGIAYCGVEVVCVCMCVCLGGRGGLKYSLIL